MMDPESLKWSEQLPDSIGVGSILAQAGAHMEVGDLEAARLTLAKFLEVDPFNLLAHEALVQIYLLAGDSAMAYKEQTRRAILLAGISGPRADCARAHATLLYGEMPQGWDLYEARLRVPGLIRPERNFTHPCWNGEAFPGKTVLLHYEQGLGDTLMFVRYASRVKALGGRVLLAAQKSLADLVATCPGIDEVIPRGSPVPPFDFHFPLLSLPWLFRTELASIPAEIPYLRVPSQVPNRLALAEQLALGEGCIRVGLAWQGSSDHPRDSERSIPAPTLSPLADLRGVTWYSFQRENSSVAPFPGILPLGPHLNSFSDTAFALSTMDLLISVDTAVAHLAGALGIPTFLLLTNIPDWRWLMDRDDSPWYPTFRLYRQINGGNWDEVVQRLVSDLHGDA
jgi:hypothetical protein